MTVTVQDHFTHVKDYTDMEFSTLDEALEQAEIYTKLGFEVTVPTSFDGGKSFSFRITP